MYAVVSQGCAQDPKVRGRGHGPQVETKTFAYLSKMRPIWVSRPRHRDHIPTLNSGKWQRKEVRAGSWPHISNTDLMFVKPQAMVPHLYQKGTLCLLCLWLRLGPPLMSKTKRYILPFCGCRHIFT